MRDTRRSISPYASFLYGPMPSPVLTKGMLLPGPTAARPPSVSHPRCPLLPPLPLPPPRPRLRSLLRLPLRPLLCRRSLPGLSGIVPLCNVRYSHSVCSHSGQAFSDWLCYAMPGSDIANAPPGRSSECGVVGADAEGSFRSAIAWYGRASAWY
eukprot:2827135-Rhodomonas_salina.3